MADTFHDRRERIFMNKQVIISIGREYGSGGHEIGEKLAKKLGTRFIQMNEDHELTS